ncbi:threonine synthase [Denitrovibrio acetiphilus DSM 12809]|uniref:Threonine synthase n=1 Tax=Denitrovibrio acetiphilus (strain DSM 12809 / NBRC 114555 / N2460) TaxID=522772 RepID=D4H487_DENA2|nr:threonine synthase [Denitrovibrio acetiphilus]ADD69216.1 threonine synthase [Denitrovibrio acetiphilus DSM 12809]
MNYISTRGQKGKVSFKDAVMMGLAEDGGLLLPESVPSVADKLDELAKLSYNELAYEIISLFAADIPETDLRTLIEKSYSSFTTPEVAPVVKKGGIYIQELFHGPTFAFKDVALQLLGNLFEYILKERSEKLNIIGATSGDTGSAAIYGVRGKDNINIFILHPKGRVSAVQEMQMTSVTDDNVFNLAIEGTFDDAQDIVKAAFGDIAYKKRYKLGAVNSINWARVLAQIVYYFYGYFQAKKQGAQKVRFVVPTGNFGNIFAGYFAKMMGLPLDKMILATNENNILSRFINNGDYSKKDVVQTYSPSMDIQIASNFERYLYFLCDRDSKALSEKMAELKTSGRISFSSDEMRNVHAEFATFSTSNELTEKTIKEFYDKTGYVLDPHTACGVSAALSMADADYICLSTAHPAKFPDVVEKATGLAPEKPEGIAKLENLDKKCITIENDLERVKDFVAKHV